MTLSSLPPDPFASLLLTGIGSILKVLIEDGYGKAKEVIRNLTDANQKDLHHAFDIAWTEASAGKYEETLKPLLEHRPFIDAVITGLLDPIEGFNVESARQVWQDKLPQYERDLKVFFRNLEKILLRDPLWQPLLEVTRSSGEDGTLQPLLEEISPDLSIAKLIGDIIQKAETGGIIIGKQARAIIVQNIQNIFIATSGKPTFDQRAFDTCLKDYLEWVENANDQARLYGEDCFAVSKLKPNKRLSDIFLPISLRRFSGFNQEEIEEIQAQVELTQKKWVYLEKVKRKQEEGSLIVMKDLLVTKNRLAIIGGPGCGKSTLLSYLSLFLARRFTSGELPFAVPKENPLLVPVLIPLRYYHRYKEMCSKAVITDPEQASVGTLKGFIPWYINRYSNHTFPQDFFDLLLRGGKCLLMLDGLDEVVDQTERGQVREEVERLAHDQYPKNLVIVTAREAGYQQDAVFDEEYLRLDVQPLSDDQIANLCENWCRQLFPSELEFRKQELVDAITVINHRYDEREQEGLIRSPLLTAMVISVKYHETELPRERARLYEVVVRVILQAHYLREDATREELIREVGGDWEEQREWLSKLALEMHQGGAAGAVISEERLKEILCQIMDSDHVQRFVRYIRQRGGLFEERAEMFQFIHLSFQEFLAARRLAKLREKAYPTLAQHLTDPWWREVFLLVYGFASMDHREAAAEYLEWLQGSQQDDKHHLAGLELAGTALLDVEKDQPALKKDVAEKIVSVVTDATKATSDHQRVRAGDTLARLGDPRFDPDLFFLPKDDMLGFVKIPAGEFLIGSDPTIDKDANNDEQPQHPLFLPDYYIARYPVTVVQFTTFLNKSGHKSADEDPIMDLPSRPVRWITWKDAMAYCEWLDRTLRGKANLPAKMKHLLEDGWRITLPSEAEWEKAARGFEGRIYPWGNTFAPDKANTSESKIVDTSAVGCYPGGATPDGICDVAGNVWEWTRSIFREYPYDPKDGREDLDSDGALVLRGGSFSDDRRRARCASRLRAPPEKQGLLLRFSACDCTSHLHL